MVTHNDFMSDLALCFRNTQKMIKAQDKLSTFRQDTMTVDEYLQKYKILRSDTGWNRAGEIEQQILQNLKVLMRPELMAMFYTRAENLP